MAQKTALPLPPGDLGAPILGKTVSFLRDSEFAKKRHQSYGPIFKTRLFGKPTVFIKGAEANRFVLTNENKYFSVTWPPSTKALLGPLALALQTGGHHQQRRKLLSQAFKPRALDGYIETMEAITQEYLRDWEQQKTLTWYPQLRNYTLDIACKLFVGIDRGSQSQLGNLFETWVQGLFSLPLRLPGTKFYRAWQSRRQLLVELENIIQQRPQQEDWGNDALGLLLQAEDENGDRLSMAELKDQILLLLFAGHETLTSSLASFCSLMAQHPGIFAKARAEQEQFPASEPLTLDKLKQMTYLEQVLQEVLRLIPPVGGGFREVLQECHFHGYRIPQGWNVLYEIDQTHQDLRVYPQPERFDPNRFHGSEKGKQFSYVPFGGGVRECLGKEFARLEMKIFATHLLRNYQWELLDEKALEIVSTPTPRPRDGLRVNFHRLDAS
ncbi:cytochrome P450 [Geitlerinema sp. PCC 9228]|jgi:cytochrome P450|uniref:cytochrome P450 n=1 Tax=Geitlerinema sp. PCC 9228 TaxID=111611 RepID=UPI0008F9C6A1|nr:cytochrome P450 [Geitlerinema sp. PCC 9228]